MRDDDNNASDATAASLGTGRRAGRPADCQQRRYCDCDGASQSTRGIRLNPALPCRPRWSDNDDGGGKRPTLVEVARIATATTRRLIANNQQHPYLSELLILNNQRRLDESGRQGNKITTIPPTSDRSPAAMTNKVQPQPDFVTVVNSTPLVVPPPFPMNKRYRLCKPLGKGSFSCVWLVKKRIPHHDTGVGHNNVDDMPFLEDDEAGQQFACKIIPLCGDDNNVLPKHGQSTRAQAQAELDILKALSHPSLLHLEDYFLDDDRCFFITEVALGGTLTEHLQRSGRLSEAAARDAVRCVLEGLAYMHRRGLIHRDLKLDNVLLGVKGDVRTAKICDFGLSKEMRASNQSLHTLCGSPLYMAPEMLLSVKTAAEGSNNSSSNRSRYDQKIDIWSCGVMLYMLLSGRPPFPATSYFGLLQAIKNADFDFNDKAWDTVSDDARGLVRDLLNPDPFRRPTAPKALDHSWFSHCQTGAN